MPLQALGSACAHTLPKPPRKNRYAKHIQESREMSQESIVKTSVETSTAAKCRSESGRCTREYLSHTPFTPLVVPSEGTNLGCPPCRDVAPSPQASKRTVPLVNTGLVRSDALPGTSPAAKRGRGSIASPMQRTGLPAEHSLARKRLCFDIGFDCAGVQPSHSRCQSKGLPPQSRSPGWPMRQGNGLARPRLTGTTELAS